MSRLDELERRVAALENEVGVKETKRRLSYGDSATVPRELPEGPYGYGSQDR